MPSPTPDLPRNPEATVPSDDEATVLSDDEAQDFEKEAATAIRYSWGETVDGDVTAEARARGTSDELELQSLHVSTEHEVRKEKGVRLWRVACPPAYYLSAGEPLTICWSSTHDPTTSTITKTFVGKLDAIWTVQQYWICYIFLGTRVRCRYTGMQELVRARITCPLVWAYFEFLIIPSRNNRPLLPRTDDVPKVYPHWAYERQVVLMNAEPCVHIERHTNGQVATLQESEHDPHVDAPSPCPMFTKDLPEALHPDTLEAACHELGFESFYPTGGSWM
ncbi:hypothetical protein BC834DRAFT_975637 [Gloeopeniophorella convolvens]|nr:hypothetical protein BC834DRAFT_975637 [Gloeopeniophorella convolvens]